MIVDGLLMMLTGLIQALWDLVPQWDMHEQFFGGMYIDGRGWTVLGGFVNGAPSATGLDYGVYLLWQMNNFLPVNHFYYQVIITLTIWQVFIGYKVVKWTIGIIRGSGTK